MKLYEYQKRAIAQVRAEFERGVKSVCLIAPTGAGKTIMARRIANDFKNVVVLVPTRALLAQASESFQAMTIQSLLKPDAVCPFGEPDLVIWDEAHHSASERWSEVRKRWPNASWLGLTATPVRADEKPLDLFETWVEAARYSELIDWGVIVPCEVYRPSKSKVTDTRDADPALQFLKHVPPGVRTLVFCADIAQCDAVVERIGPRAAAYHSKIPKPRLEKRLKALKNGNVDALVTHDMLTEGFDLPSVVALVLARPCHDIGTYLQVCGRGARWAPGKRRFHLIDCSGASLKHGNPIQDWTFDRQVGIDASTGEAVGGGKVVRMPRIFDPSVNVRAENEQIAVEDISKVRERMRAAMQAHAAQLRSTGAESDLIDAALKRARETLAL